MPNSATRAEGFSGNASSLKVRELGRCPHSALERVRDGLHFAIHKLMIPGAGGTRTGGGKSPNRQLEDLAVITVPGQ
jgi:hypothetical protein